MTTDEMIEQYYEYRKLLQQSDYPLYYDLLPQYQELCTELLYRMMKENKDVFERLKNR